jgi:hypothetical protein
MIIFLATKALRHKEFTKINKLIYNTLCILVSLSLSGEKWLFK